MSDQTLTRLAEAAGLQTRWQDAAGVRKTVAPEALGAILSAMDLPARTVAQRRESQARLAARREASPPMLTADVGRDVEWVGPKPGARLAGRLTLETGDARDVKLTATPLGVSFVAPDSPGYHRLEVGDREVQVAVAPMRACGVRDLVPSGRIWGAALQVYSLRGQDGFGGFADLATFADAAGALGAQSLAISPVHALFAADPSRYSPYAPSSRLFLNSLYADPDRIEGAVEASVQAPSAALINWATAAPAKLARLRDAYQRLIDQGGAPLEAFHTFRRKGGRDLERHARFETLHAHFFAQTGARGWPDWPQAFHDPESLEVAALVHEQSDAVEFHAVQQWLADVGLARAQRAAKAAGMGIGLIADLAVGLDAGGSQAWSRPDDLVHGLSVGAPPDIFQPRGQDWGVAALSPDALRANGYDAFLATLRRALRHSGGVRIDHVMGLRRLWLTPHGASPADGAYLTYPFEDLLRLTALESYKARAIVIGEDLGTVPAGFREALHDRGVLGMGVLWFERTVDGDGFKAPDAWDRCAAALTTTHDLPTVAGWWSGRDIDWQARLAPAGRDADVAIAQARDTRHQDRARLWSDCVAAGVASGTPPPPETPGAAVDAGIAYVAATACPMVLVPVEDLVGLEEQPNRPGTIDEHPNWRRRLPAETAELLNEPAVAARIKILCTSRPA